MEKEDRPCIAAFSHIFQCGNRAVHDRSDVVGEGGFEPPKSLTTDLQSAPFGRSGIPPYSIVMTDRDMELVDGLEPPTC